MTTIQSKINKLNARIDQYKNSDLFTDEEADILCKPLIQELEDLSKEINVNTTEL